MKIFLTVFTAGLMVFQSCDEGGDNSRLKDPATTHSPSEAIPDSTTIVNDSVIVPDTAQ